ncbi:MAG: DNA-binding protein [Candidatus Diapherotrites archaeon]
MNEEEWRAQREQALREKTEQRKAEEEKRAAVQNQLDVLLNRILTPEAKQRITNVRLVNEEKYLQAAQTLMMLMQQGRIQGKITDDQLKQVLTQIGARKNINITRK